MVKPTEDNFGGSLTGYLDITYAELVTALGGPNARHDGYKTDAEWAVELADGTKAHIYNYKDGKNYNGDAGTATEDITEWHVGSPQGGYNQAAGRLLVAKLNEEIRQMLGGTE